MAVERTITASSLTWPLSAQVFRFVSYLISTPDDDGYQIYVLSKDMNSVFWKSYDDHQPFQYHPRRHRALSRSDVRQPHRPAN